jgi:hypothetical protein
MERCIIKNKMTGMLFGPYHANSEKEALDIFARTRPYKEIEIEDFDDLLEKAPRVEDAPDWGRDTFDVEKV